MQRIESASKEDLTLEVAGLLSQAAELIARKSAKDLSNLDFPAAMKLYNQAADLCNQSEYKNDLDIPIPFISLLIKSIDAGQFAQTIELFDGSKINDNDAINSYVASALADLPNDEHFNAIANKLSTDYCEKLAFIYQKESDNQNLKRLLPLIITKQTLDNKRVKARRLHAWLTQTKLASHYDAFQLKMNRAQEYMKAEDPVLAMQFAVQAVAQATTASEKFEAHRQCIKILQASKNTPEFKSALSHYTVNDDIYENRLLPTEHDLLLISEEKILKSYCTRYILSHKLLKLLKSLNEECKTEFLHLTTPRQLRIICLDSMIHTHWDNKRQHVRKVRGFFLNKLINNNDNEKFYVMYELRLLLCKIDLYGFHHQSCLDNLSRAIHLNPYADYTDIVNKIVKEFERYYQFLNPHQQMCDFTLQQNINAKRAIIEYCLKPGTPLNEYFKANDDKIVSTSSSFFSTAVTPILPRFRAELKKMDAEALAPIITTPITDSAAAAAEPTDAIAVHNRL